MDEPLRRTRSLRKNQTDAERQIWARLRNRRFASFKFRRQVSFGSFIVDFVCFDCRLIIELDGGQHTQQRDYDERRTAWLEKQGFRVIRVWNHDVWEYADAVDETIWQALNASPQSGDGESNKSKST